MNVKIMVEVFEADNSQRGFVGGVNTGAYISLILETPAPPILFPGMVWDEPEKMISLTLDQPSCIVYRGPDKPIEVRISVRHHIEAFAEVLSLYQNYINAGWQFKAWNREGVQIH